MKTKQFNIKIYNLSNTFQEVLQQTLHMDRLTFTESINAGQGELRLRLNLPFDSTEVAYNQIVRVYESHEGVAARCIYTGVIGNIQRIYDGSNAYIEVRAIGLASMLTWAYYKDSGNYAFSKNQGSHLTLKAIVDYFGTLYSSSLITYTGTSVENGATSNIAFNYTKCMDAIKNVVDTAQSYWWSIDNNGVLQFHPKTGSAYAVTHKLNIDLEVEKITVEENVERVINKYVLTHGAGTVTSTDATSQSAYGLRELKESRTDINDGTTAQNAADTYIAANKDYKRKIRVTVNDNYDIETIHAGHFLTINNSNYEINALQIQRISYNIDKLEIELEEVTSLTKELFS